MKIAIIGSIGSGKSCVIGALNDLKKVTFDCDIIMHEIMRTDDYVEKIRKNFKGVVEKGKINNSKLGNIVFGDKQQLALLNSIAHPLVKTELERLSGKNDDIFVEVSAYKGSGLEGFFDKIIGVVCEQNTKIERIIKRSGYEKRYILSVLGSQPNDDEIAQMSDFIVINDGDLNRIKEQVKTIVEAVEKSK